MDFIKVIMLIKENQKNFTRGNNRKRNLHMQNNTQT